MATKKEKHTCNLCEKDFDELITRDGFMTTYFVEWVCSDCFKELEGMDFEDYPGGRCEQEIQTTDGN